MQEQDFQINLARFLAASIVHFSKEFWTPAGTPVFCGGDPPAPTAVESTREMLRGYEEGLPGFLRVTRTEAAPTAEAAYNLTKTFAPLYSALQTQVYGEQGKELNKIGREIARENALAQSATDTEVLKGPGKELILEANALNRTIDPEYYQTREKIAAGLAELLSGKLTGGEEEALQRSINRERIATGQTMPSALTTASAALRFGEAANNKLANALALATGALPSFRSGTDVLMQTIGRPSSVNPGDTRFLGITPEGYGTQAYSFGQNLLNNIGENQRLAMEINANRRDTMDRIQQGTEIAKNIFSTVGSIAGGFCYILLAATDLNLPQHTYAWLQTQLSPKTKQGYIKMSKWLVPLMIKYTNLKKLIRKMIAVPFIKESYGIASFSDKVCIYIIKAIWRIYACTR